MRASSRLTGASFIGASALVLAACSLFTSLGGLTGGDDDEPTPSAESGTVDAPPPVETPDAAVPEGAVPEDADAALDASDAAPVNPLRVEKFRLIDIAQGIVNPAYDPLPSGVTLSSSVLGQSTVEAVVTGGVPGGVIFSVDGRVVQVETNAPYTITRDDPDAGLLPWTPDAGHHVISATPYKVLADSNTAGTPLTIDVIVAP